MKEKVQVISKAKKKWSIKIKLNNLLLKGQDNLKEILQKLFSWPKFGDNYIKSNHGVWLRAQNL